MAYRHAIFFLWRPFLKDPKDDLVLELAVEAQCDHIITFNTKDFAGSGQFGHPYFDAAGVFAQDRRAGLKGEARKGTVPMSTLSLRLPESLHKQMREMAEQEGISINQFAATAIAEKLSALLTSSYLEQKAARGERARFDQALSRVSAAPAEGPDRL